MNEHEITEQAYRNGYEAGVKKFAEKIKNCCYQLYEEKNGHEAGKVVVLEFADIDNLANELTEGKE